jgi:MacB-like periplasmic core domain/FtsX-like permease family
VNRPRGWRPLRHVRLQQVLAVAAIATAVALPVVLLSVGGGVSTHELADLENSGYQLVVSAAGEHGISGAHGLSDRIAALGSVAAASPVLSVAIDAFPDGGPTPVLAEGVVPGPFTTTLGPAESDLFPNPLPLGDPTDSIHYDNGSYAGPATNDVLISSPLADADHLAVGASLLLSPGANPSPGTEYNVTGIFGVAPAALGPTGAFAVLLPLSNLQVMTGYARSTSGALIDAADSVEVALVHSAEVQPSVLDDVQKEIQSMVPFYGVSSLNQQAQQLQAAAGVLTGFYLALSSVGVIVGLLFLALVLVRRVESGRRAIGIRRALGLPGRWIAGEILASGTALALAGSVVGVVGGYVIVEALAAWGSSAVQEAARLAVFVPTTLAALVVGVVALSLAASAVAVRVALRVDISEALR